MKTSADAVIEVASGSMVKNVHKRVVDLGIAGSIAAVNDVCCMVQ